MVNHAGETGPKSDEEELPCAGAQMARQGSQASRKADAMERSQMLN